MERDKEPAAIMEEMNALEKAVEVNPERIPPEIYGPPHRCVYDEYCGYILCPQYKGLANISALSELMRFGEMADKDKG